MRVVAVGLVVVAVAVGCRKPPVPQPPAFRVRIVTSAPVTGRWERAAERGLGLIAAELGADVARVRARGAEARRATVDRLGAAGIDLVFCLGRDFEQVVYTDAGSFPATRFVIIPGETTAGNVASIDLESDGAGFVAGAVAAAIAGDAAVGVLRGPGGAWLEGLEAGFSRAVQGLTGSPPVVRQLADGAWPMRGAGVAIALLATDRDDRQVLAEAANAGLLLIAIGDDLLGADDVVAAVVEVDLPEAMLRVAREVHDGTFVGKVYTFDLGSGVLDVHLDGTTETLYPAAAAARDTARAEVTAGYIEVEGLGM